MVRDLPSIAIVNVCLLPDRSIFKFDDGATSQAGKGSVHATESLFQLCLFFRLRGCLLRGFCLGDLAKAL